MTREQFLNGEYFRVEVATRKGAPTFNYRPDNISQQIRAEQDGRIILDDYHCNVSKIGTKGFEGFTFVLGKRVKVKFKFEDLILLEEEA